jgi:hypothetical protein
MVLYVLGLCRAACTETAVGAVVVGPKVGYATAGRATVVDELGMFLDGHDVAIFRIVQVY